MAPPVHHRHHRLRSAATVTYVQCQSQQDATSPYVIVIPSSSVVRSTPQATTSVETSLSPPTATTAPPMPKVADPSTAVPNPTTSNYPQPPTFLYPEPLHVHEHTMQRAENPHHGPTPPHPYFPDKPYHETPSVPLWLAAIMFVTIATATSWALLVCLIHLRGSTTGMTAALRTRKEERRQTWWTRVVAALGPWARKSAYTALNSGDESHGRTPAAHDIPADWEYRSPLNPYLVPPGQAVHGLGRRVKPRGSAEWADEHRAFFASNAESMLQGSCLRTLSSNNSLSDAELEDVESEAREAQGRPRMARSETQEERLFQEARMSWVDLGLAVVDRAVDRFGDRIVKWTDDNGGDEELVLPLSKRTKAD